MTRLFGFSIEDNEKNPPGVVSPIPPSNQDGAEAFSSSGFFGSYNLDIEGLYRNETDLIRRYRTMALYPECDSAIEDIVNEAIVADTNDSPVAIELSNLNASDNIKKIVREIIFLKLKSNFLLIHTNAIIPKKEFAPSINLAKSK